MTKHKKGWTPERRAAQRERILKNRPWEKSTGPKTPDGKTISSLNARKHGKRSDFKAKLRRYLRAAARHQKECERIYHESLAVREMGHDALSAYELIKFKFDISDLSDAFKKCRNFKETD